ncbi:MFS transporter [Sphingomonas rhizophila]|uniref:MFS transporter n=1 Tax=Sphingomonas rhizophila TaxID=2071607 RepID=A0A7G9S9Q9_9SPHN|nr:MFS transporter [Sphingomonas rhizophila]QNN64584.1 MFS transporter [Sphingomonas rhizophila]
MTAAAAERQSNAFLFSFALAWAGGAVAYTAFLTLLLPLRFTEIAGSSDVGWLGLSATVGAIFASVGHIFWGWVSDRWGRRRAWAVTGLAGSSAALMAVPLVGEPAALIVLIAVWQLLLNCFLAPLSAYAADSVPNQQKGILGGLLSFGPGAAALSVVAISLAPPNLADQLGVIVLMVVLFALPLMAMRRAKPIGAIASAAHPPRSKAYRRVLIQLWVARLAVQIAEGLLFLFLYYFLREVSGGDLSLTRYAVTNAVVHLFSIPIALMVGRYSDKSGRRRSALLLMIGFLMAGLAGMGVAKDWNMVILSYGLFLIGSNSFLALHSAFSMQELRDPRNFGRDLGLFNLTNTLPSLTTPLLAAIVISQFGYSALLLGLAAFMIIPAGLIFRTDIP